MTNRLSKLFWIVLLVTLVFGAFGHVAYAAATPTQSNAAGGSVTNDLGNVTTFFGLNLSQLFYELAAYTVNLALSIASWLIAIAGFFLNFSINMTLHIKDFVDNTQGIYLTWVAIRDISTMFIIFFLLYAALKLILGLDTKIGSLIKNIVIVGMLINFSFFIASIGIDASNIVSMQLYNAIAPANSLNAGSAALSQSNVQSWLNDGGLSDIFMQSLQITHIYNTKLAPDSADAANAISAPFKIIFSGLMGILIELTAAASFMAASIAFVMRFVVLVVLLAFSPIWIASYVVPQLKEYSDKWSKLYKSMLLFMPVYLLFMYFALNVLTSSSVLRSGYANNLISSGGAWYSNFLILGMNAFFVLFLVNLPLVAAVSVSGGTMKWVEKSGLGGDSVRKWFGSRLGSSTIGRAAYSLGNSRLAARVAGTSPIAGQLISSTMSKVSNAGFGGGKSGSYEARVTDKAKAEKAMHEKIGKIDSTKYDNIEKRARTRNVYNSGGKVESKTDTMTDLEYAKDRAKFDQQRYRSNLPWKGAVGGVIGFMVDNRANRQTSAELSAKADKDAKEAAAKKGKEEATKKINEMDKRLREIAKETKMHKDPLTMTMSSPAKIKELEREEERIKEEMNNQKVAAAQGSDVENKEVKDKLDEILKKTAGGDASNKQ